MIFDAGRDECFAQRLARDQRARKLRHRGPGFLTSTRQKPCAEASSIGVLSADTRQRFPQDAVEFVMRQYHPRHEALAGAKASLAGRQIIQLR